MRGRKNRELSRLSLNNSSTLSLHTLTTRYTRFTHCTLIVGASTPNLSTIQAVLSTLRAVYNGNTPLPFYYPCPTLLLPIHYSHSSLSLRYVHTLSLSSSAMYLVLIHNHVSPFLHVSPPVPQPLEHNCEHQTLLDPFTPIQLLFFPLHDSIFHSTTNTVFDTWDT